MIVYIVTTFTPLMLGVRQDLKMQFHFYCLLPKKIEFKTLKEDQEDLLFKGKRPRKGCFWKP